MATKSLVTANVVVVANTFNVSIFNQLWLRKNEVFTEEELLSAESAFLPMVSQVGTPNCHLLVLADRLQLTLKAAPSDLFPLDKIKKVVRQLPETPYTAIGLNIVWHVVPGENEDVGHFTRDRFAVPERLLYQRFSDDNARFGAYMSRNFEGFRLKLDLKPAIVATATSRSELVQLNFNFHRDLENVSNRVDGIVEAVDKWTAAYAETEAITTLFAADQV